MGPEAGFRLFPLDRVRDRLNGRDKVEGGDKVFNEEVKGGELIDFVPSRLSSLERDGEIFGVVCMGERRTSVLGIGGFGRFDNCFSGVARAAIGLLIFIIDDFLIVRCLDFAAEGVKRVGGKTSRPGPTRGDSRPVDALFE